MTFHQRLRRLHAESGMTVTQLARSLRISPNTVYLWETGKATPRLDNLLELSALFGCSLDYLAGLTDERTPPV